MARPSKPRLAAQARRALRRHSAITGWAAAALWLAAAIACTRTRGHAPTTEVDPPFRFPHDSHRAVTCGECHDPAQVVRGVLSRPGSADHAPCDRGECHQVAFLTQPGPLCEVCHLRGEARRPAEGEAPFGFALRPYPPVDGRRALAAEFSHAQHLTAALMERAVGFHVGCTDCHADDDRGQPASADHTACARCHADEAVPEAAPPMSACAGCHVDRDQPLTRTRTFITGDLHFEHRRHERDQRGTPIACATCHVASAASSTAAVHPEPEMPACVACHDDENRTPASRSMRACETCHLTKTRNISTLAPRSHLPARALPEDHTLAFRKEHGADARSDGARCARCHTFMSGSPRSVCDECHQSMRPTSHVVTWREFDHGPEAAIRADACATCHTGSFCTACHSRPPRSHFPMAEFRSAGHAMSARMNLRKCITCHLAEVSCTGAGCHLAGPLP